MIPADYIISVNGLDVTAVVTQSFFVNVQPGRDEYTVTSNISNSYEFGKTIDQAIKNYLEILVEELVWLEKHKTDLSPSILEDLYRLKIYLRIV